MLVSGNISRYFHKEGFYDVIIKQVEKLLQAFFI